jgi:DNA-binding HxlR family transcriptional regulator
MVQNGRDSSNLAVGTSPSPQEGSEIPVAVMVESIVGCKWSVRLLMLLADGLSRPSALLRACPGLSAKVMNERLRKMTRFGMVQRTVFGEKPPVEVDYILTPFGIRFMKILDEVQQLQEVVDNGTIFEDNEFQQKKVRI